MGAARRPFTSLPVERERRFAKGEAVEMICNDLFEAADICFGTGFQGDNQYIGLGLHMDRPHWEGDIPPIRVKPDLELVAPMFAQLLEIAAGAGGGDGCGNGHGSEPFDLAGGFVDQGGNVEHGLVVGPFLFKPLLDGEA